MCWSGSDLQTSYQAVRTGVGKALLPGFIAKRDAALVPLATPEPPTRESVTPGGTPNAAGRAVSLTLGWVEAVVRELFPALRGITMPQKRHNDAAKSEHRRDALRCPDFRHFTARAHNTLQAAVGLWLCPASEGTDQHSADKGKRHAHGQHVRLHRKVNGHRSPRCSRVAPPYQITPATRSN